MKRVSGSAASARITTAAPTTTTIRPSRLPASRYARSFSPLVSSAVKTGTNAALIAASAKSCCTSCGMTETETKVL